MMSNFFKNAFFKWLAIIALIWGIPSTIFWAGIKFFLDDRTKYQNEQIFDALNHRIEGLAYELTPENYFLKPFQQLYSQVRGMPINKDVLTKIIKDFEGQYPSGFIDISFFNGNGEIIGKSKEKKAYEEFFSLITGDKVNLSDSDKKSSYSIASSSIDLVGSVIPAPDLTIRRVRDKANRIITLGHPDRFSMCYFNNDVSIRFKYIGGMLCFMHNEKMSMASIAEKWLKEHACTDFGYISGSEYRLPAELKDFNPQEIADFYQQYPTSSFELKNKLIVLKRFGSLILVGAQNSPLQPMAAILVCFLIFCFLSILFFRISYRTMVMQTGFNYTVKQRLIFLFALCYALPLLAAAFLAVQYLSELKRTIYFETIQNNYRRLSEIDSGFTRFVTSRLIDYRKLNQKLSQMPSEPDKIKEIMRQEVDNYRADGVHVISSGGIELISTPLTTSECRRHQKKSQKEKQLVLDSWKLRNAPLTDNHIRLLMGSEADVNWKKSGAYKAFWQVFVSTAHETMNYYNESHGKPAIHQSQKTYLLGSMLESGSETLFQSAKASIGKLIGIEGFDAIFMGYIDIIAGLEGDAWYAYIFVFDQLSLQRQYLSMLFEGMASNREIINQISPNEDIRAVSLLPFASNFPTVMEFIPFESIIKRGSGETRAFTRTMHIEAKDLRFKQNGTEAADGKHISIEGEDCLVTAVKGSYLKGYTLIKIVPLSQINEMYHKRVKSTAAIFAVILLMGFALAKLLIKLLILPINDIFTGISSLAERNYKHRIPIRSQNEFGALAQAFNDSALLLEKLTVSERIKKQLYPENEFRCGSYLITTANSNSRVILSDFYDYFALKQGTYAVMLSEVSGNDISASYLTAILKTSFTLLAPCFPNHPEAILAKLNSFFMPFYRRGHLTTCMLGILDPTNDCITLANAGQTYPIMQDAANGSQSLVLLPSSPLGISLSTKFKCRVVDMRGKFTVFYSDGAVDLLDKSGIRIGRERFMEVVSQTLKSDSLNPAKEILHRLNEIAADAPWRDDITIMCIQNRI